MLNVKDLQTDDFSLNYKLAVADSCIIEARKAKENYVILNLTSEPEWETIRNSLMARGFKLHYH